MKERNFDLSAMTQPENDLDIVALLYEALAEVRSVNHHFEVIFGFGLVGEGG